MSKRNDHDLPAGTPSHASNVLPEQPPSLGYPSCAGCDADAGQNASELIFLNITVVPCSTVMEEGENPLSSYVTLIISAVALKSARWSGAGVSVAKSATTR